MSRLHPRMEPAVSSRLIAASMEAHAKEVEDFDAVVHLYWPRVFRFALASLRDRDAAQTVAQDCFLRAYRARDRFRGEASLKTWLMQIAVNLVRDHTRNRRLQFWKRAPVYAADGQTAREWIADTGISPERRVLVMEQVNAVWTAAGCLSQTQRTVFLLRHVEELELIEIAAVTGLKEGAVKVHLFRALRKIRAQVGRLR